MIKNLKNGWRLFRDSQTFLYQGLRKNLFKEYLKTFLINMTTHLGKFHHNLNLMNDNKHDHSKILQKRSKDLHSLLPDPQNFKYSIIISLDHPSPKLLQSCLSSACLQSAPNFEILIGTKIPPSPDVLKVIYQMEAQYPEVIKLVDLSTQTIEDYSSNQLVRQAKGNYLFFLDQHDWIRPDLLYRYEQLLRTFSNKETAVINCFEDQINKNDHFIPGSTTEKIRLQFPYVFEQHLSLHGMLIPKALWQKIDGLRMEYEGSEIEDLILRLDLADADFTTIPISLYSSRTNSRPQQNKLNPNAYMQALRAYSDRKGLNWTFEEGYLPNNLRAIPQNIKEHKIQIIIPFKDQKELTLRCVSSILKQSKVHFKITAVDNGSKDLSIESALRELDIEVMRIDEPFNYSRLNNLAVANTKTAQDCDLILFLNNDVELDENALVEMLGWIDQPGIGMVGARLHYPSGQLQHGGIILNKYRFPEHMWWEHTEKFKTFDEMVETKKHAIVDAVTTACALMTKENFLKVGGFDEIWHPIAFSDTSLAVKLDKQGLKCFYTPYAFGIHHESITRKESIEDVENSRWLHQLIKG
ncbi:MAG TPA: glycosyltransferase [Parachlamydiaceae bacterium]|nr:glycosyltransferase [Parachlamydiaceae bacterium]